MPRTAPSRFEWVGGARPLDFTNTVTWTRDGLVNERLATYADLVDWAVESGAATAEHGTRLKRLAARREPAAGAALGRAQERRRVLHAAFLAAAAGCTLGPGELRDLNQLVAELSRHLRLATDGAEWSWRLDRGGEPLDAMLDPVLWEGIGLLLSGERGRLKHCAADDCGWVFLDRSRNHARRWCDMKVCGNNEKARRFYRKQRGQAPAAPARGPAPPT